MNSSREIEFRCWLEAPESFSMALSIRQSWNPNLQQKGEKMKLLLRLRWTELYAAFTIKWGVCDHLHGNKSYRGIQSRGRSKVWFNRRFAYGDLKKLDRIVMSVTEGMKANTYPESCGRPSNIAHQSKPAFFLKCKVETSANVSWQAWVEDWSMALKPGVLCQVLLSTLVQLQASSLNDDSCGQPYFIAS